MNIIPMVNCSINDALNAMNEGFQDYSFDMQMNVEQFIETLGSKKLSPDYSFVAFDEGHPVGIILNSIQHVDGKKTSYNGGTAVHPDYRKKGVGRGLVEASMELFKKEGVELSTLEAISDNQGAIRLYESFGYHVVDRLSTMRMSFEKRSDARYILNPISLAEWKNQRIAIEPVPWQNRIAFINEREIYAINKENQLHGYVALSRSGDSSLTIFQLQVVGDNVEYEELLKSVENHFAGFKAVAFNVPHQHPAFQAYQKKPHGQLVEQVWMKKHH